MLYEGGFVRAVSAKDRSVARTHEQLQAIVGSRGPPSIVSGPVIAKVQRHSS